ELLGLLDDGAERLVGLVHPSEVVEVEPGPEAPLEGEAGVPRAPRELTAARELLERALQIAVEERAHDRPLVRGPRADLGVVGPGRRALGLVEAGARGVGAALLVVDVREP